MQGVRQNWPVENIHYPITGNLPQFDGPGAKKEPRKSPGRNFLQELMQIAY